MTSTDQDREMRPIAIVPHTHWDREWYDPFQTYRMKLVSLVDELLDLMEGDPSYSHFMLDGQLAVVDDYLEIRPENEDRLRALISAGRISVGPWYVLMDEFLVSAETIVRNLELGRSRARAFGRPMAVGYLPDMFGHIAQMPQLLRLAGLHDAVVWRGVPSVVDRPAFLWSAPDGSVVRAEYLLAGYGNGAALPPEPISTVRRLDALLEEFASFLAPHDPLLVMNGSDHLRPQPQLGAVVSAINDAQHAPHLEITSLEAYLAQRSREGLPTWTGELRSGARANVLMGVGSNRVDVKQAAATTERALEVWAEPLSTLFLPAESWPEEFLAVAWREVIRNSAHDSICACSADEVVVAVLHRYAEARQIAEGLTAQALAHFATSLTEAGHYIINPTAHPRSGMVELVLPLDGPPGPDIQVLSEQFGLPGTMTLDGVTVKNMLGLIQGTRIGADAFVTEVQLRDASDGIDVLLTIGTEEAQGVPVEEVKRELYTRLTSHPEYAVHLHIDQPPVRRILGRSTDVPGFGWSRFSPAALVHPVSADGLRLANGLVDVTIDPADGTFALDGVAGFGRLVDGGDHGDTYNYSPPLSDRTIDRPESVSVEIVEEGPVRARASITATYLWPAEVDDQSRSRSGERSVTVTTTIEVRADEPYVRVETEFVNPSRDHRLRVHLPLPQRSDHSEAECAFAVVRRGLVAEGRPDEAPTPTFPSKRFVQAGGLTVVHHGLVEYELVDVIDGEARTLALTVLRATGMLSRLGMTTRPLPAGPLHSLEGPQMLGPVRATYALCVTPIDPYRMAEDVLVPLAVQTSFGGGERPVEGSALACPGAEVSSLRRRDGAVELRLFNPTDQTTSVTIAAHQGSEVNLAGAVLAPFTGARELGPYEVVTLRFDSV